MVCHCWLSVYLYCLGPCVICHIFQVVRRKLKKLLSNISFFLMFLDYSCITILIGFPPFLDFVFLRDQIKTSGLVPARFDLIRLGLVGCSRDATTAIPARFDLTNDLSSRGARSAMWRSPFSTPLVLIYPSNLVIASDRRECGNPQQVTGDCHA